MTSTDMTSTAMDAGLVRALSEKLITFLETGMVPEGLFRPDVFPRPDHADLAGPGGRGRGADRRAQAGPPRSRRGDPLAGRPDSGRVRVRVRGAVGPRGPAVVRAGDDARRGGRRTDSRAHRLLHRRLGPGPPGRARGLRHPDPPVTAGRRPWQVIRRRSGAL